MEEVSGSRSMAERRQERRRRSDPEVAGHLSGAIQPEAEPSSQRGKRKAALEQSEGEGQKRSRKGSPKSHGERAAASASTGTMHASNSEASSTVSSPLRAPRRPNPDDFGGRDAPAYHAASLRMMSTLTWWGSTMRKRVSQSAIHPFFNIGLVWFVMEFLEHAP